MVTAIFYTAVVNGFINRGVDDKNHGIITHVNIFWVKTRLKRVWLASKTQRTHASQMKHSTRLDAV